MTGFFKRWCWLALIAAWIQSACGFALLGTKEAWQDDAIGYNRLLVIDYPQVSYFLTTAPEWTHAPHNLGEEYRWSVPVLYYTYDPSFLNYFGARGAAEIDSAFAILNNLKNVSDYSSDLSEVPLEEFRVNFTAQAFHLFDLKSAALEMLVTRLGCADPERWTWT